MAQSYAQGNPDVRSSIDVMYQASADDRGTVQGLARELDDANVDGKRLIMGLTSCAEYVTGRWHPLPTVWSLREARYDTSAILGRP